MRKITIVATLAVALSAVAVSALTRRSAPVYGETPDRAFTVLGPVSVSDDIRSDVAPWSALHAPPLLAAARAHYGREVDAIVAARHAPLPNGNGAISTGIAVVWN